LPAFLDPGFSGGEEDVQPEITNNADSVMPKIEGFTIKAT
jgi:hypothetical protein